MFKVKYQGLVWVVIGLDKEDDGDETITICRETYNIIIIKRWI